MLQDFGRFCAAAQCKAQDRSTVLRGQLEELASTGRSILTMISCNDILLPKGSAVPKFKKISRVWHPFAIVRCCGLLQVYGAE